MNVGVNIIRMASAEDVEATVERLERAGLDSIWLPDHLLGYYHPEIWQGFPGARHPEPTPPSWRHFHGDAWLDPFCLAANLASRTRLPIGTCVTDGTRRRAGDLYRTMLTVNQSAAGGFRLGIGAGEAMSLLPFGYPFDRPIGTLAQTLSELRCLIDHGAMPDGRGRLGLERVGPSGLPQVFVAANAERSLRLAGRYGDGWFHLSVSPELFAGQFAIVSAEAADAGRPAPVPSLVLLAMLGESRDAVIEMFDRHPGLKSILLLTPAALWNAFGLEHPAGPASRGLLDLCPHDLDASMIREISPHIPTELVEQFIVIGNAEQIAKRLAPFVQAGVRDFVFTDATVALYPPEEADAMQVLQYGQLTQLLHEMAHQIDGPSVEMDLTGSAG